jgi:putative hydrolase of the HAD superfamily
VSPSAFLLDALGTLVQLSAPGPRLQAELQARHGITVDADAARRAFAAEIAHYRANLHRGRDAAGLAEVRAECASVLRDALPPSPPLAALSSEEMTDVLLASLHFDAFADARRVLPWARGQGLRLVVVSNWDCSLHEVLARTGLDRHLDVVLTSAEVGSAKPHPAIFEQALQVAGCAPEAAVHVGDSLAEDVGGARRAGIRPILLARVGGDRPPDVPIIASLDALIDAPNLWR